MIVEIGMIYEAPWGRFVGHREGVLRSMDTPNAFSVQPHPDDYKPTGEYLKEPTCSERPPRRATSAPVASPATEAAPNGLAPAPKEPPPVTTTPPDTQPGPTSRCPSTTATSPSSYLTLGGHRPGAFVIVTGAELWWRPCLRRAPEGGIPHLYFLERADWPSLYCPACRDPDFAQTANHLRDLIATGNTAEAATHFTDHPLARLFLRISTRKLAGAEKATTPAESPRSSPASHNVQPQATTEPTYQAHCCPRIVLGLGLHSPTCKNYKGEALPALERDNPKDEVGSFEIARPTFRDRADWDEYRLERAAIFEYLGGMTRKYADIAANRLAGPPP